MDDSFPPPWVQFKNIEPNDFRWLDLGSYPVDEWNAFVLGKTDEERKAYFDKWNAPEIWHYCYSKEWQEFLNSADD